MDAMAPDFPEAARVIEGDAFLERAGGKSSSDRYNKATNKLFSTVSSEIASSTEMRNFITLSFEGLAMAFENGRMIYRHIERGSRPSGEQMQKDMPASAIALLVQDASARSTSRHRTRHMVARTRS